jgi:hypothetical protein
VQALQVGDVAGNMPGMDLALALAGHLVGCRVALQSSQFTPSSWQQRHEKRRCERNNILE